MQITNGKVSFTRCMKPADYEKKEATVELSFGVDDGEDAAGVVEQVGQLAQEKALQLVGLKPARTLTPAVPPPTTEAPPNPPPADKKRPGRPPNPDKLKTAPDATEVVEEPSTDPQVSADARKAAYAEAENTQDKLKGVLKEVDPAAVSDDDAVLGAESVPETTDVQLTSAITRKNAVLQKVHGTEAAKKIRALIQKYAGPIPKQSRDVPQAVRPAFLSELEALS